MAVLARAADERRHDRRLAGGGPRFAVEAQIRPGRDVQVVNISRGGALVESGAWLRPGSRTELLLCGNGSRASVSGRVDRCHIVGLEPLRYRVVIRFDETIEINAGGEGSE